MSEGVLKAVVFSQCAPRAVRRPGSLGDEAATAGQATSQATLAPGRGGGDSPRPYSASCQNRLWVFGDLRSAINGHWQARKRDIWENGEGLIAGIAAKAALDPSRFPDGGSAWKAGIGSLIREVEIIELGFFQRRRRRRYAQAFGFTARSTLGVKPARRLNAFERSREPRLEPPAIGLAGDLNRLEELEMLDALQGEPRQGTLLVNGVFRERDNHDRYTPAEATSSPVSCQSFTACLEGHAPIVGSFTPGAGQLPRSVPGGRRVRRIRWHSGPAHREKLDHSQHRQAAGLSWPVPEVSEYHSSLGTALTRIIIV